jgi:hypothetical protein
VFADEDFAWQKHCSCAAMLSALHAYVTKHATPSINFALPLCWKLAMYYDAHTYASSSGFKSVIVLCILLDFSCNTFAVWGKGSSPDGWSDATRTTTGFTFR